MKCIIAGSRTARFNHVVKAMAAYPHASAITEVVSGTAKGADTFGEQWAAEHNLPVHPMSATWRPNGKFDKSAGYKRNKQMAEYVGQGGLLVAVWDGESRGTKHMIDIARAMGLLVFVYTFKADVASPPPGPPTMGL